MGKLSLQNEGCMDGETPNKEGNLGESKLLNAFGINSTTNGQKIIDSSTGSLLFVEE